jgi:hypothetical protein
MMESKEYGGRRRAIRRVQLEYEREASQSLMSKYWWLIFKLFTRCEKDFEASNSQYQTLSIRNHEILLVFRTFLSIHFFLSHRASACLPNIVQCQSDLFRLPGALFAIFK